MGIGYDERYGKALSKLPIEDWHTIAEFNRIVLNYQKMKRLLKEDKSTPNQ